MATNVNICGIPHDVIYEKDRFQIDDIKFGYIDYANAKIYINEDIAEQLREETMCHEIIHGILFHIGRQDLCNDENLVQALACAINQSFKIKLTSTIKISNNTGVSNEQK